MSDVVQKKVGPSLRKDGKMLTEEKTVSLKRKFNVLKVYKTEHPERLNSYFQGKPEGGNI